MLPKPGLIVSCYMHSMKSCTEELIETLWYMDEVETFRIEGIGPLGLARRLKDIKDKFVIGLIKDKEAEEQGRPYITSNLDDIKRVSDSGSDMVAIDSRVVDFKERNLKELYSSTTLPIMADVRYPIDANLAWSLGASIISTTFLNKGFYLARYLVTNGMRVNVEGGIISSLDVQHAKETGADWFTIGRGIHDPVTKIKHYLGNNKWNK